MVATSKIATVTIMLMVVFLVVGGAYILSSIEQSYQVRAGIDPARTVTRPVVSGEISFISLSRRTITIENNRAGELKMALVEGTDIAGKNGTRMELSELRLGMSVDAEGEWSTPDAFIPERIVVL